MPLRASKMNGFIFGFQRLVWCPKWTPPSSNSLTPILITIFLWLKARRHLPADHPAEHGIVFDVIMVRAAKNASCVPPVASTRTLEPLTAPGDGQTAVPKGVVKIAENQPQATAIFGHFS